MKLLILLCLYGKSCKIRTHFVNFLLILWRRHRENLNIFYLNNSIFYKYVLKQGSANFFDCRPLLEMFNCLRTSASPSPKYLTSFFSFFFICSKFYQLSSSWLLFGARDVRVRVCVCERERMIV